MSERTVSDALAHAEEARRFEPESLRETSRDLIVLADEVIRLRELEQIIYETSKGIPSTRIDLPEVETTRPKKLNRKQQIAEELRASDLTAQVTGRDDIDYGHHESLPRGEHVARIKGR